MDFFLILLSLFFHFYAAAFLSFFLFLYFICVLFDFFLSNFNYFCIYSLRGPVVIMRSSSAWIRTPARTIDWQPSHFFSSLSNWFINTYLGELWEDNLLQPGRHSCPVSWGIGSLLVIGTTFPFELDLSRGPLPLSYVGTARSGLFYCSSFSFMPLNYFLSCKKKKEQCDRLEHQGNTQFFFCFSVCPDFIPSL